jgi:hypothetical protein
MVTASRPVAIVWLLMLACHATPAAAQLNTQHIKGAMGLKSGSQPPPHIYAIAPIYYVYNTDEVSDNDGEPLPVHAKLTSVAAAGGINVVTEKKLFGAFYGFQVLFPVVANNRIQGTEIDANPGGGLSDSVFMPISLGWHTKRADATAGYAIFAPTGRYADGATDNTGFGMWGHELSAGATAYLSQARQYHVATLVSFDFQSKKEDSDTKVGNTMNLEGGIGGDFLKGGLTAGLSYYATLKLTEDQFDSSLASIVLRGKNKILALGPEVSMAIARNGVLYGFVKATYQWEVYARTNTKGQAFNLVATFPIKPIMLPSP